MIDFTTQIDQLLNELHALGWHLDTPEDYIKIYSTMNPLDHRSILSVLNHAIRIAKENPRLKGFDG